MDSDFDAHLAVSEHEAPAGLGILQLLMILRRFWLLSLVIAVGVTSAGVGITVMLPKSYTAIATLMVSFENKDPLAGDQMPNQPLFNYVATQIDLLTSPAVLLPVVDRLALVYDPEFGNAFKGTMAEQRDLTARTLWGAIQIDAGRGGQLLNVQVTAHSAKRAALIANSIVDLYIEQEHQRLSNPAGQRAQRYAVQLAELRQKVALAQEKVTAYRTQNGIASTSQNTAPDDRQQKLSELEKHLLDAQEARRTIETNVALKPDGSDLPTTSASIDALQSKLAQTLDEIARAEGALGARHPRLLELRNQAATTEQALRRERGLLELNHSARLRAARNLEAQLQRAVDAQRGLVMSISRQQDKGAKVLLELDSAQAVYKRALDGYDQIMFSSTADHTHADIVSRAVPPAKASRPNKFKLAVLSLIAGCGVGVLVPLLYEFLIDRRVRSRDDFERSFGVQVIAELKALPRLATST